MHIIINGREIINPVTRILLGLLVLSMFALLFMLFLPLLGITIALSLGIVVIFFVVILTAAVILLFFSPYRKSNRIEKKIINTKTPLR